MPHMFKSQCSAFAAKKNSLRVHKLLARYFFSSSFYFSFRAPPKRKFMENYLYTTITLSSLVLCLCAGIAKNDFTFCEVKAKRDCGILIIFSRTPYATDKKKLQSLFQLQITHIYTQNVIVNYGAIEKSADAGGNVERL